MGTLRLMGDVSGYTDIKSGDNPASQAVILPPGRGANNQVLTSNGANQQVWSSVPALYGHRNLQAKNNTGTPNTQYDINCDFVILISTATNPLLSVVRKSPGSITNNVSTAGPAANGRDQAGAFSASSWIHFYYIWNGTTLATISSATAPPTGPTLPAGYTHWAYVGAVYFNGSSQLVNTNIVGNEVWYTAPVTVVNTHAITEQTASLTTTVPPNVMKAMFDLNITSSEGTGQGALTLELRHKTGQRFFRTKLIMPAAAAADEFYDYVMMPIFSQQFFWIGSVTGNPTSPNEVIKVLGYTIPNGAL